MRIAVLSVPLRPTQANRLNLFNSSQRPDLVPGVPVRNPVTYGGFDPAVDRVFNIGAFAPAGGAAFGNAPPRLRDAREFGIRREDVSVRKNVRFTERAALEINIQSFNVLNRNQWGTVNDNVRAADFGRVSLAGPGRFVQLGAKLRF